MAITVNEKGAYYTLRGGHGKGAQGSEAAGKPASKQSTTQKQQQKAKANAKQQQKQSKAETRRRDE